MPRPLDHSKATEDSPLLPPSDPEVFSDTLEEPGLSHGDPDGPNQFVGRRRAVLTVLSIWLLIFLQSSNMSALTTIQSTIAGDLDAFSETSWFTSTYLIAASSLAPVIGRLCQIFPPRNCILVSSIIFATGGVVTSQASSLTLFLVGRAISGVGAAGVLTISVILVLELTSKKRRGVFIGLVNTGYTSGVALGATVAGALLPVTGWRALFWAQAPLALLAGTGVFFSIPKSFVSGPRRSTKETMAFRLARIDYLGAIMLTSSIVLFLYGMSSAKIQWISIVLSGILIVSFVVNELFVARDPIIPISVLMSRGAFFTCLAQLGFMGARWTILFYTPVYALAVRGWSLATAGSILIPTNIGFALGGLLVGALHIRRAGSFYIPSLISLALFSMSLFAFSIVSTSESSATWFIFVAFLNGLCTGASLNYTLAHILHLTLPSTHFVATSLIATFRGFAGSFGSAIGGGVYTRLLQGSLEHEFKSRGIKGEAALIRRLLGSPALVNELVGVEKEVAIIGYVTALQGLFAAASGLAMIMVLIQAISGWRAPTEQKVAEILDDGGEVGEEN